MSIFRTIVVRMPEGEDAFRQVQVDIDRLLPHITAMSWSKRITALDVMEGHDDLEVRLFAQARAEAERLVDVLVPSTST